jgi:hypothetical protein
MSDTMRYQTAITNTQLVSQRSPRTAINVPSEYFNQTQTGSQLHELCSLHRFREEISYHVLCGTELKPNFLSIPTLTHRMMQR